MTEIVRVDGLSGYRELVAELGGDGEVYLRHVGLDPAIFENADAYLPFRKLILALEYAAAQLNCPDFGLRFAGIRAPDTLGALAVAMQHAETGREGLACAARFMHFHNTALRVRVQPHVDAACEFVAVDIHMRKIPKGVQIHERLVAASDRILRVFGGPAYRAREVWFRHQPFAPLEAYRRAFEVTPKFGMSESGVAVAKEVLDQPLAGANAQLKQLAVHFLEGAAPNAGGGLAAQARVIIGRMMRSGEALQNDLAETLGLHERTLQRRLKEEGVTFESLKDDVRRDIAQTYLAQKSVSLSHIAELLGYAEASAFTRASRRWFGRSPRDMRKALIAMEA